MKGMGGFALIELFNWIAIICGLILVVSVIDQSIDGGTTDPTDPIQCINGYMFVKGDDCVLKQVLDTQGHGVECH
jgi:hypothetical protein